MTSGLMLQLITGLASPFIFLPSLAIGWFARRGWQVLLGACDKVRLGRCQ
jgi:hypothetical protein